MGSKEEDDDEDGDDEDGEVEKKEKKEKKDKKDKKDKKEKKDKKDKKEKKDKKSKKEDESVEFEESIVPKKRVREEDEEDIESPSPKRRHDPNSRENELFIGNLPFNTTESDIRTLFEGVDITRVHFINNNGACFLTCATKE